VRRHERVSRPTISSERSTEEGPARNIGVENPPDSPDQRFVQANDPEDDLGYAIVRARARAKKS
jgi:hypothetical protein